jgi:xylose dehydrogenase (NAD/NADP)
MREVFAVFAQRVLADEAIGPDGAHALVDVAATAAIYEAAEQGRTVTVRPP